MACTFSTSQLPKWSDLGVFLCFDLNLCFAPQRRALFRHLNSQKWSDIGVFFYVLTWTCALRHNGAHFFDISTPKSGPTLVCFFMFWLELVLCATTARTFWTSQFKKVLRSWSVLYILIWKCASRHNGVQFFISHLASWLRTGRFSEVTFRPSRVEKHSGSRLSYLFVHLHLLSSHSFSSLIFFLLCFSSLTLPTSAFPSVHIVGSLTSELPSIITCSYDSYCALISAL